MKRFLSIFCLFGFVFMILGCLSNSPRLTDEGRLTMEIEHRNQQIANFRERFVTYVDNSLRNKASWKQMGVDALLAELEKIDQNMMLLFEERDSYIMEGANKGYVSIAHMATYTPEMIKSWKDLYNRQVNRVREELM